jgi:alkanesulfonate monooxygenase SsuD/methylene tetrahydromethanopterin reductase-like flavin-dependent oxidoreductase (luciferase family)
MRKRVAEAGRPADALKVLFVIGVKVTETEAAGSELRAQAGTMTDAAIVRTLAGLASLTGIDFARLGLDEPLGDLSTNGQQGTLAQFVRGKEGKTLRQVVTGYTRTDDLVGTPQQVARRLGEMYEATGGDGFLISTDNSAHRKHLYDVTEGLAPELQRLGLTRREYESEKFRDNLFAF